MAGRRRTCLASCLLFASVFFYAGRSLVHDLLSQWPFDDHSPGHLLAEDALRDARDSVHHAMQSLLNTYGDGLQKRDRLGTTFERLQVSLDNFHRGTSVTLGQLPVSRYNDGHHVADVHEVDICGSFAGKRITMIGGDHIYRLHLSLLQQRERAEAKSFPCQYHEFCTHHRICLPILHSRDDAPPPRYIKPPTTQELIDTESAAVNYIVSDTLFSARNESSWEYTHPFVDPMTGIRLREMYWLAAARKANVVIVGRGPLGAPGPTYTGNWSFLRHVPDYVGKSRIIAKRNRYHDDEAHMYTTVPRSPDILNAAVHLTVSRFLPDVFQLLRSLDQEGIRTSKRKRLIWPSSWYRLPGRGIARSLLLRPCGGSRIRNWIQWMFFHQHSVRTPVERVLTLQLSAFINADLTGKSFLEDPWTLLFNAQVYLQNAVLRELLPRYGIVFLPLDGQWIMDAKSRGRHPHDDAVDADPGQTAAIGEAFLMKLDYVLRYLE